MPWIGESPDQLMPCIEIKCSYSIRYTELNEQNLDYLYKGGDAEMGITKAKTAYYVAWTTHGMVIGNITFDKEL